MGRWRLMQAIAAYSMPAVTDFKTNRASISDVVLQPLLGAVVAGSSFAARIACRSGKMAIDAASIAITARRKPQVSRRKAQNRRTRTQNRHAKTKNRRTKTQESRQRSQSSPRWAKRPALAGLCRCRIGHGQLLTARIGGAARSRARGHSPNRFRNRWASSPVIGPRVLRQARSRSMLQRITSRVSLLRGTTTITSFKSPCGIRPRARTRRPLRISSSNRVRARRAQNTIAPRNSANTNSAIGSAIGVTRGPRAAYLHAYRCFRH
jgi:hypothetical protein